MKPRETPRMRRTPPMSRQDSDEKQVLDGDIRADRVDDEAAAGGEE